MLEIRYFDKRWHILVDQSDWAKFLNNWESEYSLISDLYLYND
jgi:hypothetical protein